MLIAILAKFWDFLWWFVDHSPDHTVFEQWHNNTHPIWCWFKAVRREFDPKSPHFNPYLCFAAVWMIIMAKPHQVCKRRTQEYSIAIIVAMVVTIDSISYLRKVTCDWASWHGFLYRTQIFDVANYKFSNKPAQTKTAETISTTSMLSISFTRSIFRLWDCVLCFSKFEIYIFHLQSSFLLCLFCVFRSWTSFLWCLFFCVTINYF